ncbi:MAG: sigma 54-interacting transcriptional regulator [Bryobacteraceae bacterium]|nr:sigma 54-interacting transcriptional regulator [Bryobacteraceae bacterium]
MLQEREFQRIGTSETTYVDVRVVAATNVDLEERVRKGKFREDLFYRLSVVPLVLTPLRERREDIALLARHFTARISQQEGIAERKLSPAAMELLESYHWPGNVRQLENTIEQAIALSESPILTPGDFQLPSSLPPSRASEAPPPPPAPVIALPAIQLPEEGLDFEQTVGRIELQLLEQALRRAGGNKTIAADILRLKRTTLTAKLKSLSRTVGAC